MANVSIFQRLVGVAIMIVALCLLIYTYRDGVPYDAGFLSPIAIQTAILFVALIIGLAIIIWGWRGTRWIGFFIAATALGVLVGAALSLLGGFYDPLLVIAAALVATPVLLIGSVIFSVGWGYFPTLKRLIMVEIGVLIALLLVWELRFLYDNWEGVSATLRSIC